MSSFVGSFIYCVVLLCSIFIVVDTLSNLDEFLQNKSALELIFTYYAYLLPSLSIQMIPVSALVAVLLNIGSLSKHNELTAMKASGISSLQILLPYLFFGAVISIVVFMMDEMIVPQASVMSASIKQGLIEKNGNNTEERAVQRVAYRTVDGKMMYAREYEISTQTLHDVVLLEDIRGQTLKSKLTAKKAHYEEGGWTFENAIRYEVDVRGELIGEPEYSDKLKIELKVTPSNLMHEVSQIELMSAAQLRQYIWHMRGSNSRLLNRLWVDFHHKIAFPFISLIVILIGAPLGMKTQRAGAMVGIGTACMISAVYYSLESVCLALGKGGHMDPFISAWITNALFALVGVYLIRKTA